MPAAIDGLLALIRTGADQNIRVVDGFPRFAISKTDLIAVGGKPEPTADGRQDAAALGNRRREESYTIRVTCSSSRGGEDQKAVRDRAFDLMAIVENAVRNDVTLGGVVRVAQIAGSISLFQTDFETAADGVFAEVAFDVDVSARI
jgi:hypothetical protein